jgi:hypothetical protein
VPSGEVRRRGRPSAVCNECAAFPQQHHSRLGQICAPLYPRRHRGQVNSRLQRDDRPDEMRSILLMVRSAPGRLTRPSTRCADSVGCRTGPRSSCHATRIPTMMPSIRLRASRPPLSPQLTVKTSTLLLPPLVQPRSAEFPLGVCTVTFTGPGPEITPVVRVTFNC